jgi:chromosome segregation ATPase
MNLVGKILTVVILGLSLVFMAFAMAVYATHKNWKKVVEDQVQELKTAEDRKDDLTNKRDQLERTLTAEKASAAQRCGQLETEAVELKKERDELKKTNDDIDAKLREAIADVKATHADLAILRDEVTGLRLDIRKAQKDREDHFNEVVRLTDELNQKADELARLKSRNNTLAQDFAKAQEVLRKFNLKPLPEAYQDVPPVVNGRVRAVTGEGAERTVEISLGSDAGLRKGHQLIVYRQSAGRNALVGRIEVVKTAYDKSVCKTLPPMQSAVQEGDLVASKIQ